MLSLRRFSLAGALVLAIAFMPAPAPFRAGAQTANGVRLSFFNISPDAPAIDIYVDGGRSIDALGFGEVSDYISVNAGTHRLQVTLARRLDVLLNTTSNFQAGGSFTWILPGIVAGADVSLALTADLQFARTILLNDVAGDAPDTRPRVRMVNASPGSTPLDVRIDGLAMITLSSGLAFGTVGGYTSLDAGTYAISVFAAGGTTPLRPPYQVTVQSKTAYTLVMGGVLSGIAAANPPNPVQSFRIQQLTDQTTLRTAPLTTGCNQVILNVPVGTPMVTIVQRVNDPSFVTSVWRFDNATKQLRSGYFTDPTAPVDYTSTVASPEAAFICVIAATTWAPA